MDPYLAIFLFTYPIWVVLLVEWLKKYGKIFISQDNTLYLPKEKRVITTKALIQPLSPPPPTTSYVTRQELSSEVNKIFQAINYATLIPTLYKLKNVGYGEWEWKAHKRYFANEWSPAKGPKLGPVMGQIWKDYAQLMQP